MHVNVLLNSSKNSILTVGPEVSLSLPLDNLPSALLQKGSFQCYDKSSGNMVNKDTDGKIRKIQYILESFRFGTKI